MTHESDEPNHARRGFLIGAGAVATLAAASGSATDADAAPAATTTTAAAPQASPVAASIASAPRNGCLYRYASYFDFSCESPNANRAWGGFGVYSQVASTNLWTSFEIPPGTLIREIEWYVRNNTATSVAAYGRLWTAGTGDLFFVVRDAVIPVSAGIVATRVEVPEASWGPYPQGTKLQLGLRTPTNGDIQINGARVGLSDGGGQASVRNSLLTVYNTRTGPGKFAAGETRVITLPEEACQPGTVAVLLNISATAGSPNGILKVFSATGLAPYRSMTYGSQPVTQTVTVAIPKSRKIRVQASKAVHLMIELVGTTA